MNEEKFTLLVQPHFDRMYRLAFRLTSTVHDAEDLFQDVLVKLYSRQQELTSVRDLAPWLNKVLYHHFVDDRRRYVRQPLFLVDDNQGVDSIEQISPTSPQQEVSTNQLQRCLQGALKRLSEEHREVVLLHDSEGYTLPELEALTGIPIGTLKSRLHRARTHLRELLKKDGTFSPEDTCSSVDGVKIDAM